MMSFRPTVSEHARPSRFSTFVTGLVVGSLTWLVLLVVTRFNVLTVSAGLVAMLYVMGERQL